MFFASDKGRRGETRGRGAHAHRRGAWPIDKDQFEFCWIVDFPMYEWNEEEKKIDFSHNPFSMPNLPAEDFLALDPDDAETILALKAIQYDIVCNGIELSSGAIRNHRPDIMKKAFAIAGYGEDVLEQKFGGMLRALSIGAPPHGGIAPGIDRIVMLLAGEENLREIVLFPMNQRAEDLLMGAPSEVTPKQLRELHIAVNFLLAVPRLSSCSRRVGFAGGFTSRRARSVQLDDCRPDRRALVDIAPDDLADVLLLPRHDYGDVPLAQAGKVKLGRRCASQIMEVQIDEPGLAFFAALKATAEAVRRPGPAETVGQDRGRALRDIARARPGARHRAG